MKGLAIKERMHIDSVVVVEGYEHWRKIYSKLKSSSTGGEEQRYGGLWGFHELLGLADDLIWQKIAMY